MTWTRNGRETIVDEAAVRELLGITVQRPVALPWSVLNVEHAAVAGKYVKARQVIEWCDVNADLLNIPELLDLRNELARACGFDER